MDSARLERIRLIEQELERRKSLGPTNSAPPSDSSRQQRIEAITAELARRGVVPKEEPEYSYGDRAGQVLRGTAATYGALGDLPYTAQEGLRETSGYKDVAKPLHDKLLDSITKISKPEDAMAIRERAQQEQAPRQPLAEILPGYVDKLYDRDLSPKDTLGKFLHGAGEVAAPLPIPGGAGYIQAAKLGLKPLAKHIGKESLIASGASAGINLTPQLAEEGTGGATIENLTKGLLGAKAGHALPGTAKSVAQGIRHPIEVGAPKILSRFIAPEQSLVDKAAKHAVDLPFNVGSNRTIPNHIANNVLKTAFASEKYEKSMQKSGKSLIEAVSRQLEELGEPNLGRHEASSNVKDYLQRQEKLVKKEADVKYAKARKSLKDVEDIVPVNTLEALNSEPVAELMNKLSPSESEKSVIKRLQEISSKLSGKGHQEKITFGKSGEAIRDPKILSAIGAKDAKAVPVNDLIGLTQSLRNSLNYEKDIRGSKAFLSRIIGSLDADIRSIPNKKALEEYDEAAKFFAENVGQRFRRPLPKSLIRAENAKEAYLLTNSVKDIKALEKIVGNSPDGKRVLDSLKKARVNEILSGSIQGNLYGEGTLNTQSFANIFKSGKKAKNQELLRHLLGEKQYNNLAEVADIAEEFAKSKNVLINTSGTSHVTSDLNLGKEMTKEIIKTFTYLSGLSATGFSIAGPAGAIGGAAFPYAFSRLVANPRFSSQLRKYALARKQGREKYANTLLVPLVKMTAMEIQKSKENDSV